MANNNVTTLRHKPNINARAKSQFQSISRIHLLGEMRLIGLAGKDILPKSRKTRAVLAFLCLSEGQRVRRSQLAGVIWDRSAEKQALESLRHALRELDRTGASWHLQRERHTVTLDTTGCWIDAFETPDRAELLLSDLHGISAAFDQWLVGERVRFETRWQTALEQRLTELVEQNAAPDLRIVAARRLLTLMPTHQAGVRALMAAFMEMDEPAEAIREFERYRLLARVEGSPLSQKTISLYQAICIGARAKIARPLNGPNEEGNSTEVPRQRIDRVAHSETTGIFEPSIAVLPFRNLSSDQVSGFIAEGLTEDLVEMLSRVPGLFVVSRLSAAVFGKQDRAPQEIGAALGVRYILSGSIRVAADRMRLVAELCETEAGRGLWRSRFDEEVRDFLDLQNGLAETVIYAVAPHLRSAELKRVRSKRPEDFTAYDFFLRAQQAMHSPARAVFETAGELFQSALSREPGYAAAHAWLAYWHVMRVGQGWSPERSTDANKAEHHAWKAAECDPTEAMAFAVQGHAAGYLNKDFDAAFRCFETALQINPNSARAWLWNANVHGWSGDGANAVEKTTRAMALSPYDPLMHAYNASASLAYLADRQYDRAVEFALRSIGDNRSYTAAYKLLIPALVYAGRVAEARSPVHQLLTLEPGFTIARFRRRFPGSDTPIGEVCCRALETAGVPVSG